MELYSEHRAHHREKRHYKSKSAATVFQLDSSEFTDIKVSGSGSDPMHLTPVKFMDGLFINISPDSGDSFNLKTHDLRHYKNSKTMNMHHQSHTPYGLPLIVPQKSHRRKHKRYKSQNPDISSNAMRLPKDNFNKSHLQLRDHHHALQAYRIHVDHHQHNYRHHKYRIEANKHKRKNRHRVRHKQKRSRRYRVPTNTPYHTPQKSQISHQKKRKRRHAHFKQSKSGNLKLAMADFISNSNSSSYNVRPLSLKVNPTKEYHDHDDRISLSSTSVDHNMERNSINSSSSNNGISTIAVAQKSKRKIKQRKLRRRKDSISESDTELDLESRSSDISNDETHCSLRILCSVSSISTLSHFHNYDKYENIEALGVNIFYIDSFHEYFGPNPKQLGHGGQGSIFKIDDNNVIKSYEIGSLGLNREIFALNNILGKQIEVYIESKTENKKAFIKLPLIRGENLMEYAQDLINNKKTNLRECHLQALFGQLFVSLFYLHSKGLIHRDIKIENVMVRENGEIEFIDFGHAIYIGQDLNYNQEAKEKVFKLKWMKGKTEIFGTDCVLSPELKYAFYDLKDGDYISYGTEIDFYSIGIMGVEIIYNIFDHSYQHAKWIHLLEQDIACNGLKSGLSLKCLNFLHGLIHTNPQKRLKMHEILNHPFLTEEVHDKLGYDNWYSDDDDGVEHESFSETGDIPEIPELSSDIPFIDDVASSVIGDLPLSPQHSNKSNKSNKNINVNMNINITMKMNDFECMVKQELVKHKVTLICNGLMNAQLSYHPRIQHLNKLIVIIKECVAEKESTYPHVAAFILSQFENPFVFQLKNYPNHIQLQLHSHSKSKCVSSSNPNKYDKISKKTLSLHKKLYQVIIEFTNHYKTELILKLSTYLNMMLDCNGYNAIGLKHKLNDHFIGCIHRIINVYAFKYQTFMIILECIDNNLKQKHNSTKMKRLCISFIDFILSQYLDEKHHSRLKLINHPMILNLIESIIKYGLNHSSTKLESQSLLKTFKLLDEKMDQMDVNKTNKKKHIDIHRQRHNKHGALKPHCVTPQVQVTNRRKKYKKHVKQIKSMDHMDINEIDLTMDNLKYHKRNRSKSKSNFRNRNKPHHKSQNYISLAHPPPKHKKMMNNKRNKDGFVIESTSEIHHFDDICAAANDDDVPLK